MIKVVTFFLAFLMAVEYLINIKLKLWENFLLNILCFVSGLSFGHWITYWYLRKDLQRRINQEIDPIFSKLK